MKKTLIAFLLTVITLTIGVVAAQDDLLPDTPIMKASIKRDRMAWSADSQTLLFQVDDQGYQYNPATSELTELDKPPFTATLTAPQKDFFQSRDDVIARSPYAADLHDISIVYSSTLFTHCGMDCDGTLLMTGSYCEGNCDEMGLYLPFQLFTGGNPQVVWSRSDTFAMSIFCRCGSSLYYNYFGTIYLLDKSSAEPDVNQLFDLSEDGKRILYNKPDEGIDQLMLWEMESFHSAKTHVINIDRQKLVEGHITGAGFIPNRPGTILFINDAGINTYDVSKGRSDLLNPAINATWVQFGLFSPDNRYLAVMSNDKLYVIPSGIEDAF